MSLSVQWGNAGNSGGSVDVTFPISFTKTVYQIQLTYNSSSYENPTYAIKDTRSFSYWSKYGGDKLWFAIGAQQWGYGTWENTQRIITVTLPIPFTNTKYFSTKNVPTLADGHYTEDHEICTFNQTTTTFQFYHQHNAKIGDIYQWFAIGL